MVRAPSGLSPRGTFIMSRNPEKRKYRPGFEALDPKQLMSAGIPAGALRPWCSQLLP